MYGDVNNKKIQKEQTLPIYQRRTMLSQWRQRMSNEVKYSFKWWYDDKVL